MENSFKPRSAYDAETERSEAQFAASSLDQFPGLTGLAGGSAKLAAGAKNMDIQMGRIEAETECELFRFYPSLAGRVKPAPRVVQALARQ